MKREVCAGTRLAVIRETAIMVANAPLGAAGRVGASGDHRRGRLDGPLCQELGLVGVVG